LDPLLETPAVELLEWQAHKQLNAALENIGDAKELAGFLLIGSLKLPGIFHAPVRRHRLSGPDRTDFARCFIADSDHEIHHRRISLGELVPVLAVEPVSGEM